MIRHSELNEQQSDREKLLAKRVPYFLGSILVTLTTVTVAYFVGKNSSLEHANISTIIFGCAMLITPLVGLTWTIWWDIKTKK